MRGPATTSPNQTACRQRLRFRPLPAGATPAGDHPAHRPPQHREQRAPGPTPLGRRAHLGLVCPLPPPRRPLRAPRRHLHRLPPHRRQPYLLALRPEMVLLGALSQERFPGPWDCCGWNGRSPSAAAPGGGSEILPKRAAVSGRIGSLRHGALLGAGDRALAGRGKTGCCSAFASAEA